MTEKEFDEYMAFLNLQHLNTFRFQPSPYPPQALAEFKTDQNSYDWKKRTKEEKQNVEARVFGRPDVQEHHQHLSRITAENLSHAFWIEEYIRVWRDAGNKENARKCWDIYNDYPLEIRLPDNQTVIWRKKVF